MKNKDLFLNIGMVVMILAVVVAVLFKFVIKPSPPALFKINDLEKLVVTDMAGNPIQLVDLLDDKQETFIGLFEMHTCYSCIFDTVELAKQTKIAGKPALIIPIHDVLDDVQGWSTTIDFSFVYMMKRMLYHDQITCPVLPVIIKMKNRKVIDYKFVK